VPGYSVGGKTGTAQKLDESGRYSRGHYVAWFAGFVPANRPELVILVMLDEPQGPRFHGGDIAAPAFSRIARPVLQYLGTAPDRDGTLVFDRSARVKRAQNDTAADGGGARHAMRRRNTTRGSGAMRLATASLFGFSPRATEVVSQRVSATAPLPIEPELESLMPDLTDLSMRRASEALASVGLECLTRGKGRRATRQEPAAGTQLSRGENCTVFY
jgi:hypothetical protein